MCGRMNISDHEGIREFLAYLKLPLDWSLPLSFQDSDFANGFNIAPGSRLKVICAVDRKINEEIMQWGIKPSWEAIKHNQLPSILMYARAETVWQKKSFAKLMVKKRIAIPVNGFYEWRQEKNVTKPYYFSAVDLSFCFLAGVFTITEDNQFQCSVITNAAGKVMAPVHHRSPVIISPESLKDWLLCNDRDVLNKIMFNDNERLLKSIEVSSYVNSTQNDGEACIQPMIAGAEPIQSELF